MTLTTIRVIKLLPYGYVSIKTHRHNIATTKGVTIQTILSLNEADIWQDEHVVRFTQNYVLLYTITYRSNTTVVIQC